MQVTWCPEGVKINENGDLAGSKIEAEGDFESSCALLEHLLEFMARLSGDS